MERKEAIRSAYRLTGESSFYDGMITCSTLSGKAVCRLVWAMNKVENDAYLEEALSGAFMKRQFFHTALRDSFQPEKPAGAHVRSCDPWKCEEHGMVHLPESRINRSHSRTNKQKPRGKQMKNNGVRRVIEETNNTAI